ncbi:Pleckstrin homology domain-containing family H member 2 [Acipenser ruthenus]|uniref:Pleckstrin homology domain-containing family H member 2 n=1 Tax=Acipenser ruthenus TaxID=7906 RepID=A0A444V0Y0_ACIRT|nr:Pleckstrin homology domain-containing family H member 2 [Acipenser ruthenus]
MKRLVTASLQYIKSKPDNRALDPEEGPKGMADVMETGGSVDWQKRCVALETQLLKFRLQASKIRELLAERFTFIENNVRINRAVDPEEGPKGMADVMETGGSVDWQKRCVALETQLLKFRLQASKIRELLAERVHVMEEKLKSANVQPSESENSLFRRYQELSSQAQEKDEVIQRLEVQLEKQLEIENHQLKLSNLKQSEQIQVLQDKIQALLEGPGSTLGTGSHPHDNLAGVTALSSLVYSPGGPTSPTSPTAVEEGKWQHSARFLPSPTLNTQDLKKKGAEVSESQQSCPTSPLVLEDFSTHENHDPLSKSPCSVRKQTSPVTMVTAEDEVLVKAKDVQASPKSGSCSPEASLELVTRGFGPELPEGLIPEVQQQLEVVRDAHSPPEKRCVNRCLERDNSFDELNSNNLHCSSSPSKANMPSLIVIPALTPKHSIPSLQPAFPSAAPSGTSMTLPKVRTPLTPRDSIQLAKKHYSQPQPGADRLHHINVSIDISSFKPIALPPQCTLEVEETDIDEVPDKMDMEDCEEGLREERISFIPLPEELEFFDVDVKPPTPPLHRFPSWESRIYAVAKSGMRLSEVTFGTGSPSRAAGPFTHLIYKNVTVPVYTTLKGKATQISNIPFPDESSGSEDDTSSLASLRTSTLGPETKKSSTPGSPRATKRGEWRHQVVLEGQH